MKQPELMQFEHKADEYIASHLREKLSAPDTYWSLPSAMFFPVAEGRIRGSGCNPRDLLPPLADACEASVGLPTRAELAAEPFVVFKVVDAYPQKLHLVRAAHSVLSCCQIIVGFCRGHSRLIEGTEGLAMSVRGDHLEHITVDMWDWCNFAVLGELVRWQILQQGTRVGLIDCLAQQLQDDAAPA